MNIDEYVRFGRQDGQETIELCVFLLTKFGHETKEYWFMDRIDPLGDNWGLIAGEGWRYLPVFQYEDKDSLIKTLQEICDKAFPDPLDLDKHILYDEKEYMITISNEVIEKLKESPIEMFYLDQYPLGENWGFQLSGSTYRYYRLNQYEDPMAHILFKCLREIVQYMIDPPL